MEHSANDNIFWLHHPQILFTNYLNFVPNKNMSEIQIYNSITRLCLYFILLIIIFNQNKHYIFIAISVIIIIIVMYYISYERTETKIENFTNTSNVDNPNDKIDTYNNQETLNAIPSNKVIESGYYDSNDKLVFNRIDSLATEDKMPFSADLTFECKRPTPNNPFMNPDLNDYDTDKTISKVVACNSDDENINNEITKSFNSNLFKNIEDVFESENSQRQFYTVPNTYIPNNQTEFGKWLFKSPTTCKEDQEKCLRYEDIRHKRSIY